MHYRIYLFCPRPYLGERIAVAATLHLPSERRFYLAPSLPAEPFLTQGAAAVMRMGLKQIEGTPDERELHKALGLHWKTKAVILPAWGEDWNADDWMRRLFE